MYKFSSVKWTQSDKRGRGALHHQPGEISLLLELLLHFSANLAGGVVDFADLSEEGCDLVAAEKTSCPSLQKVTQAGLNGSWRGRSKNVVCLFICYSHITDKINSLKYGG